MGSTWAALWMDLCHSVEIFIHSLLGCSGKIFLSFFFHCGQKINHVIVKRFGFLHKTGKSYICHRSQFGFKCKFRNLHTLLFSVPYWWGNQNAFFMLFCGVISYWLCREPQFHSRCLISHLSINFDLKYFNAFGVAQLTCQVFCAIFFHLYFNRNIPLEIQDLLGFVSNQKNALHW